MSEKIGKTAIVAFLIFGMVASASAFAFGNAKGKRNGPDSIDLESLGLTEDATREEIREARWQEKLSDLGLTEESTVKEFHEARTRLMQEKRAERLAELGLTEDASRDEIHDAMKAQCEENPEDCKRGRGEGRKGGRGQHRPMRQAA